MLVEIRLAMYSSASGGALSRSWTAFLRRIAMRVSSSGGWTSVSRPHSNRLRSRSSSVDQPLRRAVAGDHDLLARVVQGVEGVEELLLGSFLVLQELDVVDQQHVDVAVAAPEAVLLAVADHVDEVVGELLRAHVAHPDALVEALRVVADGVQQVRLAQPGVAVDEQRVVGLGRRFGDRDARRRAANRLLDPMTNVSKVYFGLSLVWPGRGRLGARGPRPGRGCGPGRWPVDWPAAGDR